MSWDPFLSELKQWLGDRALLEPQERWVLGVSGGADSTLLAHAMAALSQEADLDWRLHIAHLHHGLRGAEADEDSAFVQDLADTLSASFHSERVNVADDAADGAGTLEEVARNRRYAFLERVALLCGATHVAVAHHADDDAETILHRVCRGTGLRGLAGMRSSRPIRDGSRIQLVRPLLHRKRTEIEALLAERDIEPRTDSSNASARFTRNRLRNVVLPMLREEVNPNISDALLRLAEQARWLGTYLQDAAARVFDSLVVIESPRRLVLNTPALLSKQKIIQAEVIRLAASLVIGGEQDLTFTHIEAVLKLATDKSSGKEVHLPGAVIVRKQYDRLEFRPRGEEEEAPEFVPAFVECPGFTQLPMLHADLLVEETVITAGKIRELREDNSPYEELIDLERVLPPLFVRGRKEGDRFHPLGAPGMKTLSDFFKDEKIDPMQRARTGVLCDQVGPIWIMPLRIDERVKLRNDSSRGLKLTLKPHMPTSGIA